MVSREPILPRDLPSDLNPLVDLYKACAKVNPEERVGLDEIISALQKIISDS